MKKNKAVILPVLALALGGLGACSSECNCPPCPRTTVVNPPAPAPSSGATVIAPPGGQTRPSSSTTTIITPTR